MESLEYPDERKVKWFRHAISTWARDNFRDFPWRRTTDPYVVFVAEFLLQQTDAPRIVSVYQQLLTKYPTLNDLAMASVSDLAVLLRPLGLHYRASRIFQSAHRIVSDPTFGGKVPDDKAKLLQLPGVGNYMACSICANAFSKPFAVIDINISRILQRFFGLKPHRARARDDPYFWEIAQRVAPRTDVGRWNLSLIDFGTAVCTSRNPRCTECPLRQRCEYLLKSLSEQD
jgi:A/G-specific adenine glycosylase